MVSMPFYHLKRPSTIRPCLKAYGKHFPADTNVLTERRKRDQHRGSLFPNYKKNFLSAASTFFLTAFPFATEDLTRITLVFFFPFKIFLP